MSSCLLPFGAIQLRGLSIIEHDVPGVHRSWACRLGFAIVALGLVAFVGAGNTPALAQQNRDLRGLSDQLNRMRQDLNELQRQVYQGQVPSGAASPNAAGAGQTQAARTELRLTQFENELRGLTGQVEQMTFRLNQVTDRLDRLVADVDLRLQEIEGRIGLAMPVDNQSGYSQMAGSPGLAPATDLVAASTARAGTVDDGNVQTLGTLRQSDLEAQPAAAAEQPVPSGPAQAVAASDYSLPGATAKENYDHAFGLLRQANFEEAELALTAFLDSYSGHPLAGNAKYWLGETFYVRGDYKRAAIAFAEGYQSYPESNKAPDSLLKLGMSLASLGNSADACGTFSELLSRYPDAAPTLIKRTRSESQKLGCT